MAVEFEKLKFTRDWNSSADFPTYEENEQKVRADLQALHDETKEFINETLIPGIENMAVPGTGDMLADVYDPQGKRTDVYKYVDDSVGPVSAAFESHSDKENNPHHVTASQVQVSESVVESFKETGGWSVDGILALLGSTMFGGEVLYRWNKQKSQPVVTATGRTVKTSASSILSYPTIYYSSEVTADANGKMTLVNPSTLSFEDIVAEKSAAMLAGYYISFKKSDTKLYKVTETTAYRSWSEGVPPTAWYYELSNLVEYSWGLYSELLTSTDPNAYTDGYVDEDGFTYTVLEPISAFVPRIQTGSYVGTGTSGVSNTCSLTFSFAPQIVLIRGKSTKAEFYIGSLTNTLAQNGYFLGASTGTNYYAAINDKTLSWYGGSAANQMNTANEEFDWFAIG